MPRRSIARRCAFVSCALACAIAASRGSAQEWPQFRGPDGQGHAVGAKNLLVEFADDSNVAWKAAVPGKGWSSPVVGGDEIWMTYGLDRPATDAEKKASEAKSGGQPMQVAKAVSLHAICVSRTSGEILADVDLFEALNPQAIHDMNSYASCTPVLANGRLYCTFGSFGTACVDTASRKIVWKNEDIVVAHSNGPGSHPVLFGDRLILHFDGTDRQFVVGFDVETGKVAWHADRSGKLAEDPEQKKAYATPLVVEQNGRPVAVSPGADWVYGYDPRTGEELWKLPYGELGYSTVPRPVVGHGMFYVCTSFNRSSLLAIRYDGVALPEIVWRYDRQVSQKASPLLVGDEIYFISDKGGVFTCLDAKTGEEIYAERLGGNYSASPLFADGKIYLASHEGEVTVVAPGREYRELAKNVLDGQIMASPVAIDEALYVRTAASLYRFEKP